MLDEIDVTGICHCGKIKITAKVKKSETRACHCTDCQKFSGAPFRAIAVAPRGKFSIQGTPKEYIKIGDSGNKRIQAFCGKCSTSLYSTSPNREKFSLRTGFLDQREYLIPKKHIYGRSSVKWLKNIYNDNWVTTMPDSEPFEFE